MPPFTVSTPPPLLSAPRLRADLLEIAAPRQDNSATNRRKPRLVTGLAWVVGSIVVCLCIEITLSARLRLQLDRDLERVRNGHRQELEELRETDAKRVQEDEDRFAQVLQDAGTIGGGEARRRRQHEWDRRLKHDPELAHSELEKRLLQMERLGASPEVAAEQALNQVAQLASPAESRIEILPSREGYHVRVAFKLSSRKGDETGTVTRHHDSASLRREVEEVSASVMRDLYDFCGSRSLAEVTVACNRAVLRWSVRPGASQAEQEKSEREAKPVLSCIYRASMTDEVARTVGSWRSVSLSQVISKLNVEKDTTQSIRIRQDPVAAGDKVDPQMQPSFE